MSGPIRRLVPVSVIAVGVVFALSGSAPAEGTRTTSAVDGPTSASSGARSSGSGRSDDEARAARELRDLARAWSDGGGRYGYPFWDKAAHRWRAGEISASLFREYVTGYRDRLVSGCDLLNGVDTSTDVSDDVRALVMDACTARLEGLRMQQRMLDEVIRDEARPADTAAGAPQGSREAASSAPLVDADPDAAAKIADESVAAEQRRAELEAGADAKFQEAWRDARLAMDQAQAELDAQGSDRLAEDAFI